MNDLNDPAVSADPPVTSAQPADLAEEEEEEEEHEEIDDGPSAQDLRDDLAANAAEARRSSRRTMDVLKEFGTTLTSMSVMVRDLHTARTGPNAPANTGPASEDLPKDWALALIDLHDRMARLTTAFQKAPGPNTTWWPGGKAALALWADAWKTQQSAVAILQSHLEVLLSRAQLCRVPTANQQFDPNTMTAIEAVSAPGTPDHRILAELLPGWRHQVTNQLLRPAQVRVARNL